jgi:riboflavin transporter FmnP
MSKPTSMHVQKTTTLVGTAMLGALVVVFDYVLKFSGWKIPFPWLPALKFDFTGIPIVLSLLLYGLGSGATTSAIAFLAIALRSGDFVSASMKAMAEFSTILGMVPFRNRTDKVGMTFSLLLGLTLRVGITSLLNLAVLPVQYPSTYTLLAVLTLLPLMGLFNVILGCINIVGGYFIYKAMVKRTVLKTSPTTSAVSLRTK